MKKGERIKMRREQLGITQTALADMIGESKQTIYKYESGVVSNIPSDKIEAIANALDVSPAWICGWEQGSETPIPSGFDPLPDMAEIPLVGRIACGEPITAKENLEGYVSAPAMWHATFALICKGDSMEPTICDGDLVAIKKGVQIENGQIAAVRIGDEATLKRVYIHKDYIELRPENPAYTSIILRKEEISEVAIEGLAVGLCRGL
ncbi:LexA family transcriptional regulator [Zongyangia sp. HA2173]|uniref:LexA family protein n=1 Tax=Zongyangia sp. HA2173 TaxID=3133035 RepID=UPI003169DC2E